MDQIQWFQQASHQLLSVCVPCLPRDIPKLENLLKSIAAQTVRPHEVVIALSETDDKSANQLRHRLSEIFPVVVTSTIEYAGSNRNRAATFATSSILSFIDADDEMHPQRLEIVSQLIEQGHRCVVHSYTFKPDDSQMMVFDWKKSRVVEGVEFYKNILDQEKTEIVEVKKVGLLIAGQFNKAGVHHGHPTCNREDLQNVVFSDEPRGHVPLIRTEPLWCSKLNNHFCESSIDLYHPSVRA